MMKMKWKCWQKWKPIKQEWKYMLLKSPNQMIFNVKHTITIEIQLNEKQQKPSVLLPPPWN